MNKMTKQKLNVDNLEQSDIEAGLLSSADAIRGFLVEQFDKIIKGEENDTDK